MKEITDYPRHIYLEEITLKNKKKVFLMSENNTFSILQETEIRSLTGSENTYFLLHCDLMNFKINYSIIFDRSWFPMQKLSALRFIDEDKFLSSIPENLFYSRITNSSLKEKLVVSIQELTNCLIQIEELEIKKLLNNENQLLDPDFSFQIFNQKKKIAEMIFEITHERLPFPDGENPSFRFLKEYSEVELQTKSLITAGIKQLENQTKTKCLSSNYDLDVELENLLVRLLVYGGNKVYKNSILQKRRSIQLKISYVLLVCFGLKEKDLLTITINDIRDLLILKPIQVLKRNLLLNSNSLRFLNSITDLNEFLYLKAENAVLWDLHSKSLITLLNSEISGAMGISEKRLTCHQIRTASLIHLLKNPVYKFSSAKELSLLYGLSANYLMKLRNSVSISFFKNIE